MAADPKYNFLSNMESKLPNLISHNRILEEYPDGEDYKLLFQTKKPYTMDEVIDMFEHDAQLHILYLNVNNTDIRDRQLCGAFSHPENERMYKFFAETNGDGFVDRVWVSIFSSLDIYAAALATELQLHKDSGPLKMAIDEAEIYRIALLFGS